jgi:hypothetical protein
LLCSPPSPSLLLYTSSSSSSSMSASGSKGLLRPDELCVMRVHTLLGPRLSMLPLPDMILISAATLCRGVWLSPGCCWWLLLLLNALLGADEAVPGCCCAPVAEVALLSGDMAATPTPVLLTPKPPLPLPPLLLWLCRCSRLPLPSPIPAAASDADSADVGVLQCRLLPTDEGLAVEKSPVPPELPRL